MTKNNVVTNEVQVPQDINLQGVKVAILVTDGFEQVELIDPKNALDAAGAETLIVSPKDEQVRGCMTSWPSLKSDLTNAGADWVEEEVTVDRNLLTSRKPEDIPAFNAKMIELFSQVVAPGRTARP